MNSYGLKGKSAVMPMSMLTPNEKNQILLSMSNALLDHTNSILEANALDLAAAKDADLSPALIERLSLNHDKIKAMAKGIQDVIKLPDPVGELIESFTSPDGLAISKVRVPLGLLLMIYESRPNVTADAAALAIKSGNAMILKGGKESLETNKTIASVIIKAAEEAGLPSGGLQFIDNSDREITNELLTTSDCVDAVIPRGGKGLKAAITQTSKVPVLMTGSGLCHLYIGASADTEQAKAIVLNAKVQRPGVCNAIETLLIDEEYPDVYKVLKALHEVGVELRLSDDLYESFHERLERGAIKRGETTAVLLATDEDWETEYLALTISVKTVKNVKAACEHIQKYTSGHSEAILTYDEAEAEYFLNAVDSACVYWNASTRFTDGGCFGFGCEIGISTQKLHARGPMGLRELTSYKYKIKGYGDIRA